MRIIFAITTTVALMAAATANDPLPADWSAQPDGTLVHEPSDATCPLKLVGFTRTKIESKGAPDLGICAYTSDNDREGLIRVRQYVRGAGETPLAIKNDEALIEPRPGTPDVVIGFRVGPGPEKNGAPTRQTVLTSASNGLLIDCVGRQLASDTGDAASEFAQRCSSAQPRKR